MHRQTGPRRNDIDLASLDLFTARDLLRGERRLPAEKLGQKTFVVRVEMLDHDISEVGFGIGGGQHLADRFKPARRCPDSDNTKATIFVVD